MIYSPYATKYTREHQQGKKNPSNEPHVNLKASEREARRIAWKNRTLKASEREARRIAWKNRNR